VTDFTQGKTVEVTLQYGNQLAWAGPTKTLRHGCVVMRAISSRPLRCTARISVVPSNGFRPAVVHVSLPRKCVPAGRFGGGGAGAAYCFSIQRACGTVALK
jgi:hypothetical protein